MKVFLRRRFAVLFACAGFGVSAVAPSLRGGTLIEAEHYQRRVPDDESFAVRADHPTASGGSALSRFFGPAGHVSYLWNADRHGTYHLWIRYAANQDQTVLYALDSAAGDRARATKAAVKGTGDLAAWQWTRLGSVTLTPGPHTLTLHSAPIRIDCLWMGWADERPPPPAAQFSAERTREHLQNPIEPIVPAWLTEADGYELPAWYDAIRVSAHTRLSWPMRARLPETFAHAGKLFRSIGFQEISRHIKSGSEPAWWPSAVGAVMEEARTRNFAREIIDEAHASGCRLLVYSRHMEDTQMARERPEWQARDARGGTITRRGEMMCLNTPYADFMQARLVELARLGADGFYFDEVHMAKPICHCPGCRTGFERTTGLKYPAANLPADPVFQKAIEYRNTRIEDVFRRWRAAIHAANPECVLLIGSNTYPAMNDRHTTHRLWRVADVMKSEFNLAARVGNNRIFATDKSLAPPEVDARIALGYTLNRDACDGRPPHVWAHGIPDAVQMKFATAGMIAHGQVANLDHPEQTIPDPARFGPAVELGNRVAPGFAGARPLRWAAVHFSEYARDHYAGDEAAMWKQVLYPVHGAFNALLRQHLPVGIVTDSQLEQGRLAGYRVIFLPAPQHLTDPMRRVIAAFKQQGGLVVEQPPGWQWHRPTDGMREASAAFLSAIGPAVRTAPVQATGGHVRMHVVPFLRRDGKSLTVALANDFGWVQTGRTEAGNAARLAKGGKTPKKAKAAPTGATSKSGRADKKAPAKGPDTTAAEKSSTSSSEGENEPTIGAGAAAVVPPPCRDVRVVLRLPAAPAGVKDLVTGRTLPFERGADGYAIAVPEFECLSVLVVDLGGGG